MNRGYVRCILAGGFKVAEENPLFFKLFQKPMLSLQSSGCLLSILPLACHAELVSASDDCSFLILTISSSVVVFHLFLLKEKGGAKKFKANPNAPRVLPPTHSRTPLLSVSFFYFLLYCMSHCLYNFFKSPYQWLYL